MKVLNERRYDLIPVLTVTRRSIAICKSCRSDFLLEDGDKFVDMVCPVCGGPGGSLTASLAPPEISLVGREGHVNVVTKTQLSRMTEGTHYVDPNSLYGTLGIPAKRNGVDFGCDVFGQSSRFHSGHVCG